MDIVLRANLLRFVFFVKRKSAYEMRLSDWSSGVCSSELLNPPLAQPSSNCDISRTFVGLCRTMPLLPALLRRQVRLGGQYQPQPRRERSAKRCVGKECVSTCRSRWSPCHEQHKVHMYNINAQTDTSS